MYMEDAISALAVLPVTPEQWSTDLGYPVLSFDPRKIRDYSIDLRAAGFRVSVIERGAARPCKKTAKVVSITTARAARIGRAGRKWA